MLGLFSPTTVYKKCEKNLLLVYLENARVTIVNKRQCFRLDYRILHTINRYACTVLVVWTFTFLTSRSVPNTSPSMAHTLAPIFHTCFLWSFLMRGRQNHRNNLRLVYTVLRFTLTRTYISKVNQQRWPSLVRCS